MLTGMLEKAPTAARAVLPALLAAVVVAGCKSEVKVVPVEPTVKTMEQLAATAHAVRYAEVQIDTAMVAIESLAESTERNRADMLDDYVYQVEKLDGSLERVGRATRVLGAEIDAYIGEREMEIAEIKEDELRALVEQRRAAAQPPLEMLKEWRVAAGDSARDLLSNLRDIETLLGSDLDAGGRLALRPLMEKAAASARGAKAELADLFVIIEETEVVMKAIADDG